MEPFRFSLSALLFWIVIPALFWLAVILYLKGVL
jgi:hypothetical protein